MDKHCWFSWFMADEPLISQQVCTGGQVGSWRCGAAFHTVSGKTRKVQLPGVKHRSVVCPAEQVWRRLSSMEAGSGPGALGSENGMVVSSSRPAPLQHPLHSRSCTNFLVSLTAEVMKPVRSTILMQKLQVHRYIRMWATPQNVRVRAVAKTHRRSIEKKKEEERVTKFLDSFFSYVVACYN